MKSTSFFLAALLFSLPAAQAARVLDHASPTQGNLGTGGGAYPVMTPDGRFVVFQSPSSFLLPTGEDTNGSSDIFVFDRSNQTIERVSVRSDGSQQTGNSQNPSISEDGRYVCFISEAALEVSDTNGFSDAYVHDRQTGVTKRVSVSSAGVQADASIGIARISGDGSTVVFDSEAANLVGAGVDTNDERDVFVHDINWAGNGTTTRISVNSNGDEGNDYSRSPMVSHDGRYVAFNSRFNNLVSPATPDFSENVFRYDRDTDTMICVSLQANGNAPAGQQFLSGFSRDGNRVAFSSYGNSEFVAGSGFSYLVRRQFGRRIDTNEIFWISAVPGGGDPDGDSEGLVSFSQDGRYVAFQSSATNLVEAGTDTNLREDVFVRDFQNNTNERVSIAGVVEGDGNSGIPSISGDGSEVAFHSLAKNFFENDFNNYFDVFVSRNDGPPPPVFLTSVAKSGEAAPDLADTVFSTFGKRSINPDGEVIFDARLRGTGTRGGKNRAVFSDLSGDLEPLLQAGDDLSGFGPEFEGVSFRAPASVNQISPERGIVEGLVRGSGVNGRNNRVLIGDDGSSLFPILRIGDEIPDLGNARIARLVEAVQGRGANLTGVSYRLRPDRNLPVNRANDSGALVVNDAGAAQAGSVDTQEGSPVFGGPGVFAQHFGQLSLGSGGDLHFGSFFIDGVGRPRPKQAVFRTSLDGNSQARIIAQDESPLGVPEASLRRVLGVSGVGTSTMLRGIFSGTGINGRNNDGVIREGDPGFLLRKGDEVLNEIFVARILKFWPVGDDQLVAQVMLRGTGVRGNNRFALMLRQANDQWLVLMRTGDEAPGIDDAFIRAILRVDVDPSAGTYAVLAALRGVRAFENLALFSGQTTVGDDTGNQNARRPSLVLQKGRNYTSDFTPEGTVRAMVFNPINNRGGAGGRGLAQLIGADGSVFLEIRDRRVRELVVLRP